MTTNEAPEQRAGDSGGDRNSPPGQRGSRAAAVSSPATAPSSRPGGRPSPGSAREADAAQRAHAGEAPIATGPEARGAQGAPGTPSPASVNVSLADGPAAHAGSGPPPLASAGPAVQLAHQQLSRLLDQRVWMPGSQLPGERALAKRVGVSRSSLRLALAILEAEGRVHASAQRGWFVRADMVSEPPSVLKSFSEVARARGLTASARVLSCELRSATYEEAQRLRAAPASPVVEIVRVRGLENVPVCVDTTVLARAQETVASADLTDISLFSLLEDSGVHVMRSAYTAHAEAADHRIADLLGIPLGSPVLVCDEVTHDRTDTPVLLGRAVYRGDAYRFEATLLRGA